MVNTGTTTTTTPLKSDTPNVDVQVETIISINQMALDQQLAINRMANISITVTGVKKELAMALFNRCFTYAQSLANSDLNPMPAVNQSQVVQDIGQVVNTPKSTCAITVDKTETVDTVTLVLTAVKLRLDYMDEFFTSTAAYLSLALSTDLNPD